MISACGGALLWHRRATVLLQRDTKRELDGLSFARATPIRFVRRAGIDDQINAFLESMCGNLTCREFENATCAAWRYSNAPRPYVFGEAENAHLSIQEHDIDGKAHAPRVNAAAGNEQQPVFFGHGAPAQESQTAGLEGTRQLDVTCDTSAGGRAQFECFHSILARFDSEQVERARLQ